MKKHWNQRLVKWYRTNKRDLPWRKTKDPYFIWVSEVMLQQTKVDTVIPYYERFVKSFPTLSSLASASEESVLKHWEGLGYYSRAKNLQKGARQIVEEYKGIFPRKRDELLKITGIGPYTAGAVLSIAFHVPEHAVDGNVMRVYSRLYLIDEDISKSSSKKIFEEKVMETIHQKDPSSFNQGLMEIGATICKPKNPDCVNCPLAPDCLSYKHGIQENYPVKTKKQKQKEIELACFLIEKEGDFLFTKRTSEGLLSSLWEFPILPMEEKAKMEQILKEKLEEEIQIKEKVHEFTHIFSHLKWKVHVYKGDLHQKIPEKEDRKWRTEQPKDIAITKATQKIIDKLKFEGWK